MIAYDFFLLLFPFSSFISKNYSGPCFGEDTISGYFTINSNYLDNSASQPTEKHFICRRNMYNWGAFHQAFCQCFSLTTVISYWNPCIWLAESKFVSEKHWQNAWWNAPQMVELPLKSVCETWSCCFLLHMTYFRNGCFLSSVLLLRSVCHDHSTPTLGNFVEAVLEESQWLEALSCIRSSLSTQFYPPPEVLQPHHAADFAGRPS